MKPATITPNQRRPAQKARAPRDHKKYVGKRMPPAVGYVEPGRLPRGLDSRSLRRRALQIAVVVVIVGLVAAILAYRLILFWLPLSLGGAAFGSLRKGLQHAERLDLCDPSPHPQVAL